MLVPDFDRKAQHWDTYKRFYNKEGNFIFFDTGEVIYTVAHPDPDRRKLHRDLQVQIVATTDPDCPALYLPDGTEVPKAWLSQNGLQSLVVDHNQLMAVSLVIPTTRHKYSGSYKTATLDIPASLQVSASAYWPGQDRPPVGGSIRVSSPFVPTAEQREHLTSLIDQCRAWVALKDIDLPSYVTTFKVDGMDVRMTDGIVSNQYALTRDFMSLSIPERLKIARDGIAGSRVVTSYPHLMVKPR